MHSNGAGKLETALDCHTTEFMMHAREFETVSWRTAESSHSRHAAPSPEHAGATQQLSAPANYQHTGLVDNQQCEATTAQRQRDYLIENEKDEKIDHLMTISSTLAQTISKN